MKLEKIGDNLLTFLEDNKKRIRHIIGTDIIIDRLAMLTDIYMPAMVQHQKVFPKYKGINKGKTVVITGTGPTFDYYNQISDAIHMGLNTAILKESIKYDYYFVCDYCKENDRQQEVFNQILRDDDLVKFFGIHYRNDECLIPDYIREQKGAETFYADSYDYGLYGSRIKAARKFICPLDISTSPFRSYGTTLFIVFQFALWTHPDKIYIVGADCSRGYSKEAAAADVDNDHSWMKWGWKQLAKFAKMNYPDIEIVSINPVGLKGVFKDVYTKEYEMSLRK
ncbi:MAG: hypothetical protein HDR05_14690 [Lachnospiraceae bacterium]|nr:hypothetical protein [Lachnospiraceae bacterium]